MRRIFITVAAGFFILFFFSCKKEKKKTLFQLMQNSGIEFSNKIYNTEDFNIFSYRNFYNGGGVAIGDINNDGLADVFFTANMGSNKLYLNKGDWKFEDVSAKAGFTDKKDWSTGVTMVDINADGWLDIYVCNAGYIENKAPESKLYINNKNLTFTESAEQYGLTNPGGYATHAAFFDYDLDGDLDCYLLNNSFIPVNTLNYANKRDLRAEDWPVADFLKGGGDKLMRNDINSSPVGGGRVGAFTDVSKEAGIYGSLIGFGLGVTVGDINGDHYPDMYISNDFFERDYLYINQKNGTFTEEAEKRMGHTSLASMGADIGDINNDGFADIFTTDMLPGDEYRLKTTSQFDNIDVFNVKVNSGFHYQYMQNTLQVNNRNGNFSDAAFYSGVAASDWSWGGLFFDADNDGLSDIFICNGIYHDVTDQDFIDFFANDVIQKMVLTGEKEQVDKIISKMPSQAIPNKTFKNNGNLKFSDAGEAWGLAQPSFSNGAAYGDLDNDGDLDLVVNNVNQESFVYKNNSRQLSSHNYLGIKLKGNDKNTFAVGSTIKVFAGNEIITREVIPSRGFQSSVDYKQIIGLGNKQPDSLIIYWPDLSLTKIVKPAINKVHTVVHNNGIQFGKQDLQHTGSVLMDSLSHVFEKHTEDEHIDFYYERGVPMMLSREGPNAAVGDVNGDGLEDVYIGGAANQPGKLYLQTATGFINKKVDAFEHTSTFEDVAAVFFDCDGDGDLDLFVGSGGNHRAPFSFEFQNRLYINNGRGEFVLGNAAFPNTGMNTSVAAVHDFDEDGDLDLFIGSRSIPQNYGIVPKSFIYINNGKGQFTPLQKEKTSHISEIGMVTGAVWTDVTGDSKKELIIVGEWMTPRVFAYKGGAFVELKTNLNELFGWWQTVSAADLDGDGDNDLVLGNIGENFYIKANSDNPVKMFINDFDNNGTIEKVITRTVNGKDVPVFLKKDLTEQVVSIKKQNLKYADFAKRSLQELFPKEGIKKSITRTFNYNSSCIAYNNGDSSFTIKKMPVMVQLSSVNAIHFTDVNNDGKPDLILGGNKFHFQPQFSRLDASYGHVLLNTGNQQFQWLFPGQSGLDLRGEIKDIVEVKGKDKKYWLLLQNNNYPVLLSQKNPNETSLKKSK